MSLLKKRVSIQNATLPLPKVRHMSTHVVPVIKFTQNQNCKSNMLQMLQKKPFLHKKSLSKIEKSLSLQRTNFKQLQNLSFERLDQTFHRFKENKQNIKLKSRLKKRKIFNLAKQQYNTNILDYQDQYRAKSPHVVLDYKIQMSTINHFCFDNAFTLSRVGASLCNFDNFIYLYGGCPDSMGTNLSFHKFQILNNKWKYIESKGDKPNLSCMYHTTQNYKGNLINIGGISIEKSKIKKLNSLLISVFNIEQNTWQQFNWGNFIKHHASSIWNNMLIIHGGINEREKSQHYIHFVSLNFQNLNMSKISTYETNLNITNHKIINTYTQENRLRSKLSLDGIILFGGAIDDILSNKIYLLRLNLSAVHDDDSYIVKKWNPISLKGSVPPARKSHSFDLLPGKGLAVMLGGINTNNQYLDDLWILDLYGLNWIQIIDIPLLKKIGGIAYHATTVKQSDIYIYGGFTTSDSNRKFFLIQTQKSKRQNKRQDRSQRTVDDISTKNCFSFKMLE